MYGDAEYGDPQYGDPDSSGLDKPAGRAGGVKPRSRTGRSGGDRPIFGLSTARSPAGLRLAGEVEGEVEDDDVGLTTSSMSGDLLGELYVPSMGLVILTRFTAAIAATASASEPTPPLLWARAIHLREATVWGVSGDDFVGLADSARGFDIGTPSTNMLVSAGSDAPARTSAAMDEMA